MNERYVGKLKVQARRAIDRRFSEDGYGLPVPPEHQPFESPESSAVIDDARNYFAFRLRQFGFTYRAIANRFGIKTIAPVKTMIEKGAS